MQPVGSDDSLAQTVSFSSEDVLSRTHTAFLEETWYGMRFIKAVANSGLTSSPDCPCPSPASSNLDHLPERVVPLQKKICNLITNVKPPCSPEIPFRPRLRQYFTTDVMHGRMLSGQSATAGMVYHRPCRPPEPLPEPVRQRRVSRLPPVPAAPLPFSAVNRVFNRQPTPAVLPPSVFSNNERVICKATLPDEARGKQMSVPQVTSAAAASKQQPVPPPAASRAASAFGRCAALLRSEGGRDSRLAAGRVAGATQG